MKKTILLTVCLCGAVSALYAAMADRTPAATQAERNGASAQIHQATAPKLSLAATSHRFSTIKEEATECNFD